MPSIPPFSGKPALSLNDLLGKPVEPTRLPMAAQIFVSENVPKADLRDMDQKEKDRVRTHVNQNLAIRFVNELVGLRLAEFGEEDDTNGTVKRFTLRLTPANLPIRGKTLEQVWVDELASDAMRSTTPDFPPPPPPPAESQADLAQMRTDVRKETRRQVLADVAEALAEVEANLVPGADPAFVVVLLRDKLGLEE